MSEAHFRNLEITVVGLGLIGGSLALALRELQPKRIWGVDSDRSALELAQNTNAIDQGFTNGAVPLRSSDLIFICIYPGDVVKFVVNHLGHFKPGAVITDTAGIKQNVVAEIHGILRDDLDFVGGHPLAGKESSGFRHASAGLFQDTNYILTPVADNKQQSIDLVAEIVRAIGCRPPVMMSPADHDAVIALTSQLPHIIAAALLNSGTRSDISSFSGGSFRDATRVARMKPDLWSELLWENREYVLNEMNVFAANMARIENELRFGSKESLESLLARVGQDE